MTSDVLYVVRAGWNGGPARPRHLEGRKAGARGAYACAWRPVPAGLEAPRLVSGVVSLQTFAANAMHQPSWLIVPSTISQLPVIGFALSGAKYLH